MSTHRITEGQPRETVQVEKDPHAGRRCPERPYRLTLWEPRDNVHNEDVAHACRSRKELAALGRAIADLLVEGETP